MPSLTSLAIPAPHVFKGETLSVDIRSVLLAAGRGTRLAPLTDGVPKPVTPLLDIPLGAFALDALLATVAPVMINVSHLPEALIEALAPYAPADRVEITHERPEPYGTAGTLHALRDRLADPFVVRNGDALSDIDIDALVRAHASNGAAATLAVRRVARGADFVEREREVQLVDRRVHPDAAGALYLGAAVFDRDVVRLIPGDRPAGLASTVLGPLAADGRLALHAHDGYWRDVGRLSDYLGASLDLLAGAGPRPPVPWPGEVVEVEGGRAYIGPGATHDRGTLGPGAILLAGSSLGRDVTVTESIVWPREAVAAGTALRGAVWALGRSLDATPS
jgi:NDP-sugar pyrophosphorylase family protein